MTALRKSTILQGGVPIEVDGKAVGAIGVSGAASAQQDQEVAPAGASAANRFASQSGGIASSPAANCGSVPVTYFIKSRCTTLLQREAFYIWGMATITRSLRGSAISPALLKYIR
jgi:Haem-degrading